MKISDNSRDKNKAGEVVTCQPNHSIINFPSLLENHIAKELIKVISNIKKRILNN